jgi:hypothetical protein
MSTEELREEERVRELRIVALTEDGSALLLAPEPHDEAAGQFRLPVDDRLRAYLRGDASRLRPTSPRVQSSIPPREIQARLRAGQSMSEVATAAGVPVERIERYAGPVLAERARVAEEARVAVPRGPATANEPKPLWEIIEERLLEAGVPLEAASWDAWRVEDGTWTVQLVAGTVGPARWSWDPARRHLRAADDAAEQLLTPREVDAAAAADAADGNGQGGQKLAPVVEARKARRPSVPSWDDIVFGGARKPEDAS